MAPVLWPWPLATAPGVTRLALLGDSLRDITAASRSAPAVPREGVALGDIPGPEQWCLCPEQLLRDSRVQPQAEVAQGCAMHLGEVRDACRHCHCPLVM